MKTPPRIVVLDEGHLLDGGLDWGGLAGLGDLTVHPHTPPDQVLPRASEAEVVLTNKTPLDARTLRALPRLRFISILATGYNVVDISAARDRGIPVSNVPSYGTGSVAQHTFALILELTNRVGLHSARVAAGYWAAADEWCAPCTPVVELHGLRLGLIGRGRIARRVADIALAFGMEPVFASTSQPAGGNGLLSLDDIASTADILSLHCSLTPANRGLINAILLARMKRSALLINTARGPLVNEPDLAAALASGVIAGAALDVLSVEPPAANHPLTSLPNCLVTPHMAWMGPAARRRLLDITVQNVRAFLDGSPLHVINP